MAEEGGSFGEKVRLLPRTIKSRLLERGKNKSTIDLVLFLRLGINHHIIQINVADLPNQFAKGLINPPLMCSGSVAKTLRHDCPLVKTPRRANCRLGNVRFFHLRLIESIRHINDSPNLRRHHLLQNFVHNREVRTIPLRIIVDPSVIVDPPGVSERVLLWYREARGGERRGRFSKSSGLDMGIEKTTPSRKVMGGATKSATVVDFEGVLEFDRMTSCRVVLGNGGKGGWKEIGEFSPCFEVQLRKSREFQLSLLKFLFLFFLGRSNLDQFLDPLGNRVVH